MNVSVKADTLRSEVRTLFSFGSNMDVYLLM